MDVRRRATCLGQYRGLKREVAQLDRRLAELEAAGDGAACAAMRARLRASREGRLAQLERLQGYIDGIGDSLVRQVMVGRYIDGLTWRQLAGSIGERDEQYPRRLHNRFLARHELPEWAASAGEEGNAGDGRAGKGR